MKKIKVSTYTDESGQDTKGKLFIVCTIIVISEKVDFLEKEIIKIEKFSGKNRKWTKTSKSSREKYIKELIKSGILNRTKIYFSVYKNKLDYTDLIGSHIAKSVIDMVGQQEYKAKIFIDKTNNTVLKQIKKEIKLYRIRYQKIRGVSDESSGLIRLADSFCGLIRGFIDKKFIRDYSVLFKKFKEV